ncbi:MAG TPA: recombinase family protein [Phycisphaerae bacterium]|nr:recombinase family protein [Phycisphaerae bacterium]
MGNDNTQAVGQAPEGAQAVPNPGYVSTRKHALSRRRNPNTQQIGAVYTRYSTRFQHSTDDQVRECLKTAEAKGIIVPEDMIFSDEACSGRKRRRPGYEALTAAIEEGRVDCVIFMDTNRVHRKFHRAIQFVDEELVSRGIRCIFVAKNIDSAETDDWETYLKMYAIVDEMQTKMYSRQIRAAQMGLFGRGMVCGTLPYGYRGEVVEGEFGKGGKPRKRIAVDPEQAAVVRQVFAWFVNERMAIQAIARKLNDSAVPHSGRSNSQRWTTPVIAEMLANERYRGFWVYGKTEAIWLTKQDYVKSFEREEPLVQQQFEEFRIIDDVTWRKAQDLRGNPHQSGRKPQDSRKAERPKLLNGMMRCGYHGRSLSASGSFGTTWHCQTCKETTNQLYSMPERRLATRLICEKLSELLRTDDEMIDRVVKICREAAESQQRPDDSVLEALETQLASLTVQIRRVMRLCGTTETDIRESDELLAELRANRTRVELEIAHLRELAGRDVEVPEEAQVRQILDDYADVLEQAASGEAERSIGEARRVVEMITGGKIDVLQCGERSRKKGWAKAVFSVDILSPICRTFGATCDAPAGLVVEVELKRPSSQAALSDEVKSLHDQGLPNIEIARRLRQHRSTVTQALQRWFTSRGLQPPDLRHTRYQRAAKFKEQAEKGRGVLAATG